MILHNTSGLLVAVDGPNGAGKSTLIEAVKIQLEAEGHQIFITREPTASEFGSFVREFSENHTGISLACLISADRYKHIADEVFPELKSGKIVITDRYLLSSLILQGMDGINAETILCLNSDIIKPDLQIAVFAAEDVLQRRLSERKELTRFEKGYQSQREIDFMKQGIEELEKNDISVLQIDNNDSLEGNVKTIVSCINERRRSS